MIEYQIHNRVATITLNRPDKKNALNPTMVEALDQAVSDAMENDEIRALVLAARGDVLVRVPIWNRCRPCNPGPKQSSAKTHSAWPTCTNDFTAAPSP